jgi:Protein of unknown function (DUF3237)
MADTGVHMIQLEFEMTYRETIEGPLPATKGSPFGDRLCWQITAASLVGPRINAKLAMPGTDWMRLGADGIRRQDLRAQLTTDDGAVILLHYDTGLIRSTNIFLQALADGKETTWSDQYMRMVPEFIVGERKYAWLDQNLFIAEGRLAGPKEIEYAIYRIV